MRLFVAVKFSPEIEKSLTDLQAKMKENNIGLAYAFANALTPDVKNFKNKSGGEMSRGK